MGNDTVKCFDCYTDFENKIKIEPLTFMASSLSDLLCPKTINSLRPNVCSEMPHNTWALHASVLEVCTVNVRLGVGGSTDVIRLTILVEKKNKRFRKKNRLSWVWITWRDVFDWFDGKNELFINANRSGPKCVSNSIKWSFISFFSSNFVQQQQLVTSQCYLVHGPSVATSDWVLRMPPIETGNVDFYCCVAVMVYSLLSVRQFSRSSKHRC